MKGCSTPGSRVVISRSDNPNRKYPWTLEMVHEKNVWIGVNTSLTNNLVQEGLENSTINDFGKIDSIRREIKVSEQSRLDFLLQAERKKTYVEVKNCSLAENGAAMFPDAITKRGTKHLIELDRLRDQGHETAVLFCVQRMDAEYFTPAETIDPEYSRTLYSVFAKGVKVLAYQADVQPESITIVKKLKVFNE
jgi:sugar fermentation stimulation protein A